MHTKSLFIVAHPDDETIFFGHTIAREIQAGSHVTIVSLTRGESGSIRGVKNGKATKVTPPSRSAFMRTRAKEFEAACREHGAHKAVIHSLPDGLLSRTHIPAVASIIEEARPHKIFTFDPSGVSTHRDHQSCFFLTRSALQKARTAAELFVVQKPRSVVSRMDIWTYTKRTELLRHPIKVADDKILSAVMCYKTQAGLVNYFKEVGLLLAPEYCYRVRFAKKNVTKKVRFSHSEHRETYLHLANQYQ